MKLKIIKELPGELQKIQDSHDQQKIADIIAKSHKAAVIFCADARISAAALTDGKILAIENAGNVLDTQVGGFPIDLDHVFLIGHRSEEGKGCGACAENDKLRQGGDQAIIRVRKELPPQLFNVAMTAGDCPEKNLEIVSRALKSRAYKVQTSLINNVTSKLSPFEGDTDAVMEDLKGRIIKTNEDYRKNIHPAVLEKYGSDFIATTQTPEIIAVNKLGPALCHIFGGDYRQANMIFEAKQAGFAPGITDLTQGTAQYAWSHYKKKGSFEDSGLTLFASGSRNDLMTMLKCCENDPVLKSYLKKGGVVYGMTFTPKHRLSFYSIR